MHLVSAGITTPYRSTPTRACAMKTISPTSSSSAAWQEWPCSTENCLTVSCQRPQSIQLSCVRFEISPSLKRMLFFCRVFHQTFLQNDAGEADLPQRHGVCGTILTRLVWNQIVKKLWCKKCALFCPVLDV